jgi:7,8-dihydroneopterin aldolase/epimerase/oxygenase
MNSKLALKNLKLEVILGVSDEERSRSQIVILDLELAFKKLPSACFSDDLADTICYSELIAKIKQFCKNKSFHLIEYLGAQLYDFIKNIITQPVAINLSIQKTPAIEGLGGSVFSIGD